NQARNLEIGLGNCRKAKALGADLAFFPELWNIGCSPAPLDNEGRSRWIDSAVSQKSSFLQAFSKLARELNLSIAVTFLEEHQPLPRKSVCIFDCSGAVALNYSKVFICNFGQGELSQHNPQS